MRRGTSKIRAPDAGGAFWASTAVQNTNIARQMPAQRLAAFFFLFRISPPPGTLALPQTIETAPHPPLHLSRTVLKYPELDPSVRLFCTVGLSPKARQKYRKSSSSSPAPEFLLHSIRTDTLFR